MTCENFDWDCHGMTETRYTQLMGDTTLQLTGDELRDGWYWSPSWDGMLVHKTWHEARFDYPSETQTP
jgi:hypothetical protein